MLSTDLANTNIIAEFYNENIVEFSNKVSLILYMKQESINRIKTLQTNYWGTYVINERLKLQDNNLVLDR